MKLSNAFLVIASFLLMVPAKVVCRAHQTQPISATARKIDEYKINDLRSHDEQMRLWSNYDDFAKEPKTSKLFIIGYGDLPGGGRRYSTRARNLLISEHGVQPVRVVAIDGGHRADAVVEIWIIPSGADEPLPQPNGNFNHDLKTAWKYDSFPLVGWWLTWGQRYEGNAGRLDGLAAFMRSNSDSRIYIVVHKGAQDCEYCLRPGSELRFALQQKDYLIQKQQITASRISVIQARRVQGGRIDIWIAPRGVRLSRTNLLSH